MLGARLSLGLARLGSRLLEARLTGDQAKFHNQISLCPRYLFRILMNKKNTRHDDKFMYITGEVHIYLSQNAPK